jgi:hypothetical protein
MTRGKEADMGHSAVHFEIVGGDAEALRRFYGDLSTGAST